MPYRPAPDPSDRDKRLWATIKAPRPPNAHSKLLNMRDFWSLSGFPPALKTRYNSICGEWVSALAWPVSTSMAFHVRTPLASPGFVPTCC